MRTLKTALSHNLIGALASGLCLIHYITTPFLFVAQAGLSIHYDSHPQWWDFLDILFFVVSLVAVWWSGKTSSKPQVRLALWISWILLATVILNEKFSFFSLLEEAIYVPSVSLIFLHLYNRKYCKCAGDECCTHS
ncbi:hypothetical protein MTsPCn5_07270 [Croceitalea sp. MTPC5]|uniref:MerC domain-containing protein n=1 Tax=Croceitalea sp. MTPC5 TaxID=3056565 RepID=UPI002B3D9E0C|nr:hypothetical protein MTsPCn5_07270 [Croceitalea sp. MTPC5]